MCGCMCVWVSVRVLVYLRVCFMCVHVYMLYICIVCIRMSMYLYAFLHMFYLC